jgi:hypothetical protein
MEIVRISADVWRVGDGDASCTITRRASRGSEPERFALQGPAGSHVGTYPSLGSAETAARAALGEGPSGE